MSNFPKFLIISGMILILAGLLWPVVGRIPGIGRLPGDILIRKENFTFYFPVTTSLLISLLLTMFFSIFGKR